MAVALLTLSNVEPVPLELPGVVTAVWFTALIRISLSMLGRVSRDLAAQAELPDGLKHSGKSKPNGAMSFGHARLRRALWMPLLTAVRNAWLRAYYQRLVAGGKLRKVALVASMRKLLHAIYSVAINLRAFEPRLPEVAS